MKVSELIEKLKELPQDAEVIAYDAFPVTFVGLDTPSKESQQMVQIS